MAENAGGPSTARACEVRCSLWSRASPLTTILCSCKQDRLEQANHDSDSTNRGSHQTGWYLSRSRPDPDQRVRHKRCREEFPLVAQTQACASAFHRGCKTAHSHPAAAANLPCTCRSFVPVTKCRRCDPEILRWFDFVQ